MGSGILIKNGPFHLPFVTINQCAPIRSVFCQFLPMGSDQVPFSYPLSLDAMTTFFAACLHNQTYSWIYIFKTWRWRQVYPKRWYLFIMLHGITTQKTTILTITAVTPSKLTYVSCTRCKAESRGVTLLHQCFVRQLYEYKAFTSRYVRETRRNACNAD
jgi:hypothetical protein